MQHDDDTPTTTTYRDAKRTPHAKAATRRRRAERKAKRTIQGR